METGALDAHSGVALASFPHHRGTFRQTPRPFKTLITSKFCSPIPRPARPMDERECWIQLAASMPTMLRTSGCRRLCCSADATSRHSCHRRIICARSRRAFAAAPRARSRSRRRCISHIRANGGEFHAKGASIALDRLYIGVKLNGNFPDNPRRAGLPTIQGVLLLCDGDDGSVLAAMDSIEITSRRTAAATALAARHLASPDVDCVAICGCGEQGRAHLAALAGTLPLQRALVWDVDTEKARRFAREAKQALGLDVDAVRQANEATLRSQVIVTATMARAPFLTKNMVPAGAFVAAVGADRPEKSELARPSSSISSSRPSRWAIFATPSPRAP